MIYLESSTVISKYKLQSYNDKKTDIFVSHLVDVIKEKLRIVFLGTPEFAVASLSALVENEYDVVGVITAPDRLGGRGRNRVIESAVKQYSVSKGIKILQPKNLKNEAFLDELKSLNANLHIVVAFRMLPLVVWDMPEHGTYNLHGSLLPRYRGAAPINWAIIRGEEFTGVTTFKLKHEIDTGSIAFQRKVKINRSDYLDVVHDKLMGAGAALIIKTVRTIEQGNIILYEQEEGEVSKAPKIFHEDCKLNFEDDPLAIYNKVRGLSPYPAVWFMLGEKKVKVYQVRYSYHRHNLPVGILLTDGKSFLTVACKSGYIFLEELQLEGRKKVTVRDFLNGNQLKMSKTLLQKQIQSPWKC